MSSRVVVAHGEDEVDAFLQFHDRVYANTSAYWPAFAPLEKSYILGIGPMAEGRTCRAFLAYDKDVLVARVLAVVDSRYVSQWRERLGHVEKFEALPNASEAVRHLMNAACDWLQQQGATAARCGMGPTDMPFVIDDYHSLPPVRVRSNPSYYHALLKGAGFSIECGFVDYSMVVDEEIVRRWEGFVAGAQAKGVAFVPLALIDPKKRVEVSTHLYNECFGTHWGMSPVTPAEQSMYLSMFEKLGGLEVSMLAMRGAEPVGQVTVFPEMTQYAKLQPGRKLLDRERLNWLGIGISPRERSRGLGRALASAALLVLAGRGATHVSYTLVLDDNGASRRVAQHLGGHARANYVAYRRDFSKPGERDALGSG